MQEKFLPIGTVVLLKDATKRIMITGYCSATSSEPNKTYDYVGCLFPEANLAGKEVALFNHEQIATISHLGLDDDEFKALNEEIKNALAEESVNNDSPATTLNDLEAMVETVKENMPDPIREPVPFNDEDLKIQSIVSSGDTGSQEEFSKAFGSSLNDGETMQAKETVDDGTPVLQLELIGDSVNSPTITSVIESTSTDEEDAGAAITGLTRL